MFGVLNRFISRLDSDSPTQKPGAQSGHGFQVLRNTNLELPIEPWFDFIIGINGRTLDNPDPNLFATEVRNCAGTTISLGVYSAKGQRIRELYVPIPLDPPSLQLSLQWTPLSDIENVWHILDVIPDSPADIAGLLPYGDYVIGSPEGFVRGESGLGELVEDHLNRPLRLYVYNHEYDVSRLITITPSRSWGGTGALGCVLGFGALHRIPAPLNEPPQGPGETLFETARFSNEEARPASATSPHPILSPNPPPSSSPDFLVPANMQFNPTSPPPPLTGAAHQKPARKARAHHAISPGGAMDEYFKEGEEKSREQESPKPRASGLPPPPKAGAGPPRAAPPAEPGSIETGNTEP
ncbi:GRASP55/65 family protein [Cryomyces antarcticus]